MSDFSFVETQCFVSIGLSKPINVFSEQPIFSLAKTYSPTGDVFNMYPVDDKFEMLFFFYSSLSTNNSVNLKVLPSNKPKSLNFNDGITSNAMNDRLINGEISVLLSCSLAKLSIMV